MKMNELQRNYLIAKAAYETAFENEDWSLVDQLEDPYIDAEFALVEWIEEIAVNDGTLSQEDIDLMRKNRRDYVERVVDMAMRLDPTSVPAAR